MNELNPEDVAYMRRVKRRMDWLELRIAKDAPGASFDRVEKSTLLWLVSRAGLKGVLDAVFAEDREIGEGI